MPQLDGYDFQVVLALRKRDRAVADAAELMWDVPRVHQAAMRFFRRPTPEHLRAVGNACAAAEDHEFYASKLEFDAGMSREEADWRAREELS